MNSETDTGSSSIEQNNSSDTKMMACINQKHEDHLEHGSLTQHLEAKMDLILTRTDKVEENIESKFSSLVIRVTQLESSVQKITKDVETTKLIANDAHFESKNLKDLLAVQLKLIQSLENTVDDLQGRLRRNTLVFRGIPEGTQAGNSWNSCKELINLILVDSFGMADVEIERAHHSPTTRDFSKVTPRPIVVSFLCWEDTNTIRSKAPRAMKHNPPRGNDGTMLNVFVDQMYSPKITEARNEALKKQWQIKQKHPNWSVFPKYPARTFVKRPGDDHPEYIKDDKLKDL